MSSSRKVKLSPTSLRFVVITPQSRDQLLADVWGYSSDVTTRTVDTHIKRLREKLGVIGKYVQTIRGVGYKFSRTPD